MIRNYAKTFSSLQNGEALKKLNRYRPRYQQEYLKFNSEFDQIMGLRYKCQEDGLYTQKDVGPVKRKKAEFIYRKIQSLSFQEQLYFKHMLKKHFNNMNQPISPLRFQSDDKQLQMEVNRPDNGLDPNRLKQQHYLSELIMVGEKGFQDLFRAAGNLIVGAGSSNNLSTDSAQNESVNQEEKVVAEKTNFDVELTAIDASQKIKIIKEVRSICGLGLKEAKEAVEKLPNVIAKQATKDDAEKMIEQLKKLGCTVEMK